MTRRGTLGVRQAGGIPGNEKSQHKCMDWRGRRIEPETGAVKV